jgi:hypothetical protein
MATSRKVILPAAILFAICLIFPTLVLWEEQRTGDDGAVAVMPDKVSAVTTGTTASMNPKKSEFIASSLSLSQQSKKKNRCLISSKGSDGIGHQLESKISCIATAAALEHDLEYVHSPMASAEHGTNGTSFETFIGIQQSLPNVKVLDEQQFQIQQREPLPWVGKCREPSWFQPEIRQAQCQNASATTVFVADNCWDYFYCALKRDENVTVPMEHAFVRLRAGYMGIRRESNAVTTSSITEQATRILTLVVHIRRTDSGRRKLSSSYYSHLIRQLVDASPNGDMQLSVIVHTDQAKSSKRKLLPELGDSYNVTIRDKTSVSMQTVFDDMVQADIFVTSRSSLSNAAALMGRVGRPVLYPFDKTRVGLSSLQGWTMLRESGKGGMERFQRLEHAWQAVDGDFYRNIISNAQKSKAKDRLPLSQ